MSGGRPLHAVLGVVDAGPRTAGRIAGRSYPFLAVVADASADAAVARAEAVLVADGWAKVRSEKTGVIDPDRPPGDPQLRNAVENARRTGMTILVYDDPV